MDDCYCLYYCLYLIVNRKLATNTVVFILLIETVTVAGKGGSKGCDNNNKNNNK